ncbi:MAG: sensor histidine kinase [Bryobacteraceae bacterium]
MVCPTDAAYRGQLKAATAQLIEQERLRFHLAAELGGRIYCSQGRPEEYKLDEECFRAAVERLPDDSKAGPVLNRALELMRQAIEEGRNAVRCLRLNHSPSLDLEEAFSRIQQEMVTEHAGKDVDSRVIVNGQPEPLHPILRDEVYRIGREALLNAFRHARAKAIAMEIAYSGKRLSIRVRDDGCGIDPAVLQVGRDGHWGLSGMRERADRIGAHLQVMSNPTAGTEVHLPVPITQRDQPAPKLRWFKKNHRGRVTRDATTDPAPNN